MKSFNNHSGLRGLPCFAEGIYWATGLSLTTPFTEGCPGVNNKASPPGRHQEQAPKQRCTFSPTTFSSVQFRTREVGKVQALAFGWFGECSPALEHLLSRAADFGSQHLWQPMMAASQGKARGILMWKLRMKTGAAIVRANAMLLMDRVATRGGLRLRLIRGSPGFLSSLVTSLS